MAYSLALDNIYSHYLTTYAPKSSGRYDAHGNHSEKNNDLLHDSVLLIKTNPASKVQGLQ